MSGPSRYRLERHPDSPPSPAERIEVTVGRPFEGTLTLDYRVFGDVADIRLPPEGEPGRTDDLWRHTCFEAFVRNGGAEGYLELNFTTSMQWAAYRFCGYRADMLPANIQPPWVMEGRLDPNLELRVEIDLGRLARPDVSADVWRLGLSAVIEDIDGGFSYWALAHPPGKPDFHHPDSFALTLPPPEPV